MAKKATGKPARTLAKAVRTMARVARRAAKPMVKTKKAAAPAARAGAKPAGKYVYFFGNGKAEGDRTMRDALGGKGANLAEMTNAGLPVPPGFTISTDVCNIYYKDRGKLPASIEAEIKRNVEKLEKAAGTTLGSTSNPLLVSVRSGAKFSMPG